MIQGFNQVDNNRVGSSTGAPGVAAPSAAAARAQGGNASAGVGSSTQDVSTVQGDGPELGWLNGLGSSFGGDDHAQGLQKTRHHNHVPYPGWPNPPEVHAPKPPVFDHTPKIDHSDKSGMQSLQKTRHHNHVPYPGWPNPPEVHHPKPPVFNHTPVIDHSK